MIDVHGCSYEPAALIEGCLRMGTQGEDMLKRAGSEMQARVLRRWIDRWIDTAAAIEEGRISHAVKLQLGILLSKLYIKPIGPSHH